MAAIAKYIVKRPFEHEGEPMKIGEELVLDAREADPLFKKGLLTGEQFLDPDNKEDKAVIDDVKAKRDAKKAKVRGDITNRKEAKQEKAEVKDEAIAKKREELKAMIPEDATDREDQEKSIDQMTDSQLDRKKESLEEKVDEEVDTEESEEDDAKDPAKPETPKVPKTGG